MILNLSILFWAILVSATLALIFSPGLIWLSNKLGFVDKPGSALHKTHHAETPMAGGLVILISGGLSLLVLPIEFSPELMGILGGVFVVTLFGLLDDRVDLSPVFKLLGQFLAAGLVIYLGIQVHITRIVWLDLVISFLWLVGLTNALNFVDSMDGLAVGLAGIASAFFMLVNIDSFQPNLAALSAVLLGTTIGTFLLASPPAKMFLGDSGSQALGISLASIGIAYTPGAAGLQQGVSWFTPILVLGVPIFDMILVIVSRLRRGQPIYVAATDHLYHRLTMLGLHPNRAVSLMQIMAILMSLTAFVALSASVQVANALFGSIVFAGILVLIYLERRFSA
jgi:UDP-GlcNAc:undecaprenyl-phosphate GlcNAc-1-phosphate transferase